MSAQGYNCGIQTQKRIFWKLSPRGFEFSQGPILSQFNSVFFFRVMCHMLQFSATEKNKSKNEGISNQIEICFSNMAWTPGPEQKTEGYMIKNNNLDLYYIIIYLYILQPELVQLCRDRCSRRFQVRLCIHPWRTHTHTHRRTRRHHSVGCASSGVEPGGEGRGLWPAARGSRGSQRSWSCCNAE